MGREGRSSRNLFSAQTSEKFKYKNLYLGDTMAPSGKLWSDEAFEYWQSLCSIDHPKCQTNAGEVATTTTEPQSTTTDEAEPQSAATDEAETSAAASLDCGWLVLAM